MTHITRLQKNVVALDNLTPSMNLAPPFPFDNSEGNNPSPPLIVNHPFSIWNLSCKAIYFLAPLLPGAAFYDSHVCCYLFLLFVIYYVPVLVIKNGINEIHSKHFNAQLWPYNCPVLWILFLYTSAYKSWIFERFSFELEAFLCNFKTDCILVWQLMSLTRKMVLLSVKFNIFIAWSSICTPSILVLKSM